MSYPQPPLKRIVGRSGAIIDTVQFYDMSGTKVKESGVSQGGSPFDIQCTPPNYIVSYGINPDGQRGIYSEYGGLGPFKCSDGTVISTTRGSPAKQTISAPPKVQCSVSGQNVDDSTTIKLYDSESSDDCEKHFQNRVCKNGTLDGNNNYKYFKCTTIAPIPAPVSPTPIVVSTPVITSATVPASLAPISVPVVTPSLQSDVSKSDVSKSDVSKSDVSKTDVSKTDVSKSDVSESDVSESDVSKTDMSKTDTSASDVVKSNEIDKQDEEDDDGNKSFPIWAIILIVAIVVVVLIIVVCLIFKVKKQSRSSAIISTESMSVGTMSPPTR